jgi:hypothetical protein
MTRSERAELFCILIDLQIRLAKIGGSVEYLEAFLAAARRSGDAPDDHGVLSALRTRHASLGETAEQLQDHLWTSLLEGRSVKTPIPNPEALSH